MLWLSLASFAAEPVGRVEYSNRFPLRDASDPDFEQVERCLQAWPKHPFTTPQSRLFREFESSVRVMGLGSSEVVDDVATNYPQLIVIRPNVSVMTRTTWKLNNPNGWYCFDSSVTVMAKGVIQLGCGAHLASGTSEVQVIGESESAGGVTVLGKVQVERAPGCTR
jgi:hypothetical protein